MGSGIWSRELSHVLGLVPPWWQTGSLVSSEALRAWVCRKLLRAKVPTRAAGQLLDDGLHHLEPEQMRMERKTAAERERERDGAKKIQKTRAYLKRGKTREKVKGELNKEQERAREKERDSKRESQMKRGDAGEEPHPVAATRVEDV